MRFPIKQVARVQGVRAEFEDAAEGAGRGGGPEGEFLHKGCSLCCYERFELVVKIGKFWVRGDRVKGGLIAMVALIFPDVDYKRTA